MDCSVARGKLPDYFSDLLTEFVYREVRDHLAGCSDCQRYGLSFSTLNHDLKQLGSLRPNKDFSETLLKALLSEPRKTERRTPARKLWIGFGMLALGIGLFYFHDCRPPSVPGNPKPDPAASEMLAALQTLNDKLAKMSGHPAESRKKTAENGNATRPNILELQPLHWDLEFRTSEEKKEFDEKMMRHATRTFAFEGISVWDLAGGKSPALLEEVQNLVPPNPAVSDSLRRVGDFQLPVKISSYSKVTGEKVRLSRHLHLSFLRQNSYTFRNLLKDAGFSFVYDTKDFWVLEIPRVRLRQFLDLVQGFPGIQTAYPSGGISPDDAPQEIYEIAVWIQS